MYVLGTERHEARRIDNQLRGRAGRQGDPGQTQFFVSLEDHLMRIFSPDTMKRAMGMAGLKEDEAIQSKIISRSIEGAQKKIEGFHFDSRQQVLKYDDVLNQQRKAIYERRRSILLGEHDAVDTYIDTLTLDDDQKVMRVTLQSGESKDQYYTTMRSIILQTIDNLWMDHLEMMEYTRTAVGLRQIGQRDPYVEYKKEGLQQFRTMEEAVRVQIAGYFMQLPSILEQMHGKAMRATPDYDVSKIQEGYEGEEKKESGTISASQLSHIPERNDPCPCGNGKKWKKCGEIDPEHCEWVKAQK